MKKDNFLVRAVKYYINIIKNIDGYVEEQVFPLAIHLGLQYLLFNFLGIVIGLDGTQFSYIFLTYAFIVLILKIWQAVLKDGVHAFLLVDLIYGFKIKYFKVYLEAFVLVGLLAILFFYLMEDNSDPLGLGLMALLVYRIMISILKNYLGKVLLNRKIESLYNGKYEKIYINDPTFNNSIFLMDNLYTAMKNSIDAEYKSEKLKTELITGVSHDIKTPLTSIINYVDLVKRAKTEEQREKYLKTLDYNATRLKSMIVDLIEASKTGSGSIDLEMNVIELNELILQTYGQFDKDFKEKGLVFEYNSFNDDIFIELDADRLSRVFENVFSNIVKYSKPNTVVNLDIIKEKSTITIRIKNKSAIKYGDEFKELQNRFTRSGKTDDIEGSGLGLYIAKASIELLNGEFDVKFEENDFIVEIKFATRVKK